LRELVADSPEEYTEIARRLASDIKYLGALRDGLRSRMNVSPLTDAPRFTHNLEHAFRDIWERWCVNVSKESIRKS
jgi:predicted O-linked N-acetylglucosamine transferase (SPINDLY family)